MQLADVDQLEVRLVHYGLNRVVLSLMVDVLSRNPVAAIYALNIADFPSEPSQTKELLRAWRAADQHVVGEIVELANPELS